MNLVDPNLIFASPILWTIHGNPRGAPLSIPLHHGVILHLERVIEHDIAVYSLYNVVFHQNQSINFDVDSESICVETCANFFIDLDKDVIRWFFD